MKRGQSTFMRFPNWSVENDSNNIGDSIEETSMVDFENKYKKIEKLSDEHIKFIDQYENISKLILNDYCSDNTVRYNLKIILKDNWLNILLTTVPIIILLLVLGTIISDLLSKNFTLTFIILCIIYIIITRKAFTIDYINSIRNNYNIINLEIILKENRYFNRESIKVLIKEYNNKLNNIDKKKNIISQLMVSVTSVLTIVTMVFDLKDNPYINHIPEFIHNLPPVLLIIGSSIIVTIIYVVGKVLEYRSNKSYYELVFIVNDLNTILANHSLHKSNNF